MAEAQEDAGYDAVLPECFGEGSGGRGEDDHSPRRDAGNPDAVERRHSGA